MAPIKPMVWLRVKAKSDYLADMISVYTIRNQDEDTDLKCCGVRIKCCWCLPSGSCDGCNPAICTATCSAWCCTMLTCKCHYGCKKCGCGPCHLPPKGCCDPAEDVPLYATGRGKANMLKRPGQKIMINRQGQVIGTHDVHLKYVDIPARPPMRPLKWKCGSGILRSQLNHQFQAKSFISPAGMNPFGKMRRQKRKIVG